MSEEKVETVRRLYDAVARRDNEAVLALYHPEVEIDNRNHRWAEVLRGHDRIRGLEELRAWARDYYAAWEDLDDRLDEVIDAGGDRVVTISTTRARGRTSGIDVELTGNAGVWTIRDGLIVEVAWYSTREDAFAAAGLPT